MVGDTHALYIGSQLIALVESSSSCIRIYTDYDGLEKGGLAIRAKGVVVAKWMWLTHQVRFHSTYLNYSCLVNIELKTLGSTQHKDL